MSNSDFSYVRKEMLPEQSPPVTQTGIIKWVRENLFSSLLNIFLTVMSLFVIYLALSLVLPWAFGGVWNAGSLTECREVLFSFYKGSHDGACWAVIEDRWLQFIFGFYPPELYWRPILAFVLFFVALAPVLFAEKVPGQLIWFTLAYPFLATWLIWGGSFWVPLFAAMGFVVGFIALKILNRFAGPIVANLGAIATALVWWLVIMSPLNEGLSKMIGAGRLDASIQQLESDATALPAQVAELETAAEAKAAEIANAVDAKNALLVEMTEIRIEEFALAELYEPKEIALRRLGGAEESAANLIDILNEWAGAPVAASDASEGEIAQAEAAAKTASDLLGNISSFTASALSDIADGTDEPSQITDLWAVEATAADPSIADDVATMVSKSALTDPLADVVARSEGLTVETASVDVLGDIRADLQTSIAAVDANMDTLETIMGKVVVTNAANLEDPQSRMLAQMANLTALRDEATEIAQATFRISSQDTDNRRTLAELTSLNEREVSLPMLTAATDAAREALPRNRRDMIATTQLPDDATNDEVAGLEAYLSAKNTQLSIEASVKDTYADLGLVGLRPIDSRQIGGFMLALIIGIAGIVLSLPLGVLLALGRQSHLFIVNKICVVFIEVIRGVPLIVWLFTGSLLLNYFLPPGTNFDLLLRVIIMVTLFSAAYLAEVIRGGLAALPTGQYEGADSLGLSYWQSMQLIVLPQAMKISIPGIVNTFIGLFKDTVLVVFIGLLDPIGLSNAVRAVTDWNGVYWELFVFIGVLFFIFCFAMGRYSLHLERKLQREHR
jgi:general L-amino acid transport system permease protein